MLFHDVSRRHPDSPRSSRRPKNDAHYIHVLLAHHVWCYQYMSGSFCDTNYLNQWKPSLSTQICVTRPRRVKYCLEESNEYQCSVTCQSCSIIVSSWYDKLAFPVNYVLSLYVWRIVQKVRSISWCFLCFLEQFTEKKQSSCQWFETSWRSCDAPAMSHVFSAWLIVTGEKIWSRRPREKKPRTVSMNKPQLWQTKPCVDLIWGILSSKWK